MTAEIDFRDTSVDESPATIAYALLALCASAFDFKVVVVEEFGEEVINIVDETSHFIYFKLRVSSVMGALLVSILDRMSQEISDMTDGGDKPWISKVT